MANLVIDLRQEYLENLLFYFSTIDNTGVDVLTIITDFYQYADKNVYLKLEGSNDSEPPVYFDKIKINEINVDSAEQTLSFDYVLTAKSTAYRRLKVQVQIENSEGDFVEQSKIAEIVLDESVRADHEIEDTYPSVLTDLQRQIDEEVETRSQADIVLTDAIETEISDRQSADSELSTAIANRYTKAETDALLNTKQDIIDNNHKLPSDLVDDTNQNNKFVSATEKAQITTNKNDIANEISNRQSADDELATAIRGKQDALSESQLSAVNSGITSDLVSDIQLNTNARHTHSNKSVLDDTTASFTTALKDKLDSVETNAQVNVLEGVKVNNVDLTISDKKVNVVVPTKTSDLQNDSGFITKNVNDLTNYTNTSTLNTLLSQKQNVLTFDDTPTANSDNPVKSSGIKSYVDTYGGKIDSISINGTNQPIVNKNVDLPAYPTKASLGLDQVDNTSDLNKPISTATQSALNLKADKTQLNNYYTKTETNGLLDDKQDTIDSDNMLSSDLVDDTNKTHKFATASQLTQIATNQTNIANEIERATGVESDLSDSIDSVESDLATETTNRQNNDTTLQNNINAEANTRATNDTAIDNKLNYKVHIEGDTNELSYNGDNVVKTSSWRNLKSGATGTRQETIQLANDTTAGLMSHTDYQQIRDNTSRIENLEAQTTRLLYTDNTNPTQAQIQAFVDDYLTARGISPITDDDYIGIAVVIAETYHIWRFYKNDDIGWKDDGLDTVSQFSNEIAGIILGKQQDGFVYAENDGTGSVYGWSALKTRVSNVETDLSSHTSNTSNPHNVSKSQVGLGNVDNTSDLNKPISTATQTALNSKADKSTTYTKTEVDGLLDDKQDNLSTAQLNAVNSGITSTLVNDINSNTSARHTHSNKSILDNTTASFTTAMQTKLSGIESGAEVNDIDTIKVNGVAQTITSKAVNISVPTKTSDLTNDSDYATTDYVDTHGGKIDVIKVNGTAQTIVDKAVDIAVPTNTNQLTNGAGFITKSVSDLSNYTKTSDLSAVATSGSYDDLSDKPTIPTKTSELTNDSGFLTSHQDIKVLDTTNSTAQTTSSNEAIKGSGTIKLHKVSKTGNYNDLLNLPTIPTKSSWNYDDRYVRYDTNSQGLNDTQKANARTNIGAGTSNFSGNYNDLTNKPTIPSADSDLTNDKYVAFVSQSLTTDQKAQARTNIGAGTSNFTGYTSSNKLSTDYINNVAGWTSNTGSVVSVSAGTGLSISGTASVSPTINVASGYKLPTTTEWANKLDAYTIGLSTGGNGVRHAKFMTIDYTNTTSEYSTLLKVSMVSAHGNATSYRFLQDVIISVSNTGIVSVIVYKQFGASAGTIDSVERQYGDIYYVIDTTNKIVDFYVLVGQYSQVNSTPYMRLGKALGGEITQYSGSATYYSSGDRTWGTGGDYVLKGDLANYQTKVSALGSTTKPVYISASGTFSESDTYAGGTKITLNGTAKGGTNASIYAPTSAITTSTAKQYLVGSTSSTSVAEEHTNTSCYMSNGELYSNGYVVALAKDIPSVPSAIPLADIDALFE